MYVMVDVCLPSCAIEYSNGTSEIRLFFKKSANREYAKKDVPAKKSPLNRSPVLRKNTVSAMIITAEETATATYCPFVAFPAFSRAASPSKKNGRPQNKKLRVHV